VNSFAASIKSCANSVKYSLEHHGNAIFVSMRLQFIILIILISIPNNSFYAIALASSSLIYGKNECNSTSQLMANTRLV
jgi:hypothetical protein